MTNSANDQPTHRLAFAKDDPFGAEYAELEIVERRLRCQGLAIGSDPVPYRMDYSLETAEDFVTSRVQVASRGDGWDRRITLNRDGSGVWSVEADKHGADLGWPEPGGDTAAVEGALDPDLALSPIFNSMPVLRHDLLAGGSAPELLMVWISLPDLAIFPSQQLYSDAGDLEGGNHLIHFEAPDPEEGDFVADIVFDADGLVVDYPGIATRIGGQAR